MNKLLIFLMFAFVFAVSDSTATKVDSTKTKPVVVEQKDTKPESNPEPASLKPVDSKESDPVPSEVDSSKTKAILPIGKETVVNDSDSSKTKAIIPSDKATIAPDSSHTKATIPIGKEVVLPDSNLVKSEIPIGKETISPDSTEVKMEAEELQSTDSLATPTEVNPNDYMRKDTEFADSLKHLETRAFEEFKAQDAQNADSLETGSEFMQKQVESADSLMKTETEKADSLLRAHDIPLDEIDATTPSSEPDTLQQDLNETIYEFKSGEGDSLKIQIFDNPIPADTLMKSEPDIAPTDSLQKQESIEEETESATEAISDSLQAAEAVRKKFETQNYRRMQLFERILNWQDPFCSNPANNAVSTRPIFSISLAPGTIHMSNTAITPDWLNTFLGQEDDWLDDDEIDELTEPLYDKDLGFDLTANGQNAFDFRIGWFRFSMNHFTHIGGKISGTLAARAFDGFPFDADMENMSINMQVLSFVKNSVSYGHNVRKKWGQFRMGAGVNIYRGAYYADISSENFSIENGPEGASLQMQGNIQTVDPFLGNYEQFDDAEGEFSDSLFTEAVKDIQNDFITPDYSMGVDLGAGVYLKDFGMGFLDIYAGIKDLNASFTWENVTVGEFNADFEFEDIQDYDDEYTMEDDFSADIDTTATSQTLTVEYPAQVFAVAHWQLWKGIVLEYRTSKGLEDRFGVSSEFRNYFGLTLQPWLPMHLHCGLQITGTEISGLFASIALTSSHIDFGLNAGIVNGFLLEAKGLELGMRFTLRL